MVREFIDEGLKSKQHQFITREQVKTLNVQLLPAVTVFQCKHYPETKWKFRLTPHGGREYTQFIPYSTYSTGVDSPSLRYFLALTAYWNLKMFTSDAKNAFPSMNDVTSPHVQNKRLIGCVIPPFISGTGQEEVILFNTVTNGLKDASRVLEGITMEVYFKCGFERNVVFRGLSLKPSYYRKTVGVDLTTVTPVDNNGNTCVVLVVEHFSHYPVAYPTKDYSAESVAKVLFKHYCSHGTFYQVATDPGSVFMSEVLGQLNSWLSIFHKVSLVGRHQSNGCEASSAQFLRHLRTLVLDERLYYQWSDDTVLPLINLFLASYPTQETGGFTPLQLKYGTLDATRFILPEQLILAPGVLLPVNS